jgi:trigger factor
LIGARAGEDKTLGVRFPDDYREPALAGQTGTAQVKVLRVQRPELPAVDAEFIASFGISAGTIDDFRREVRANLERELANALSARLRNHVAQRLVERYGQFDVPAGMVDAEARALRSRFWEQARRQGGNVPANAEEIPLDGFLEGARQRVKAGLLLGEIARSNELKVDPKRVQQALLAIASTYEDPTSVIAMYRQDQGLMEALANRVLEEQVAEWIAERANTRRVERSFSEIMRPDAGTT